MKTSSSNKNETRPEQESGSRKAGAVLRQALCAAPGAVVAALIAVSVSTYTPLVFDPSLYEVATASASSLTLVDPEESGAVRDEGKTYDGSLDTASFEMPTGGLADGVYTGSAYGYKSDVTVRVTIENGKIASIEIVSQGEDAEYFNMATGVISRVLSAQSVNVDAVSGATYSSKAILSAVRSCLVQASANAVEDVEKEEAKPADKVSLGDENANREIKGLLDGVYTSYTYCCDESNPSEYEPYYLAVTIVVEDGKVAEIADVYGSETGYETDAQLGEYQDDNDLYIEWAAWGRQVRSLNTTYTGLTDQIAAQDYAQVTSYDAVSGATYSSKAIAKGYNAALYLAADAYDAALAAGLIDEQGSSLPGETPSVGNDPDDDLEDPDDDSVDPDDPEEGDDDADDGDVPGTSTDPSDADEDDDPDSGDDESGFTFESFNNEGLLDGTYVGFARCAPSGDDEGKWTPYYVAVKITVEQGVVSNFQSSDIYGTSVSADHSEELFYDEDENEDYLFSAIDGAYRTTRVDGKRVKLWYEGLYAQIQAVLSASLQSYSAVSGATYSSDSIAAAYNAAWTKAHRAYAADWEKRLAEARAAYEAQGDADAADSADPAESDADAVSEQNAQSDESVEGPASDTDDANDAPSDLATVAGEATAEKMGD